MIPIDELLQSIVEEPQVKERWLNLACWLRENDDPRRAELLDLHWRLLSTCCEPDLHPDRVNWQTRMVELLAQGVLPCVPQRRVILADAKPPKRDRQVEMTFSFIPPGEFLFQGKRCTIEQGFYLGITPVTCIQWRMVLGLRQEEMGRPPTPDSGPVSNLSLDRIQDFCLKLEHRLKGRMEDGSSFRLPTEAEWEYACRAGTTTRFFVGKEISQDQASVPRLVTKRLDPPRNTVNLGLGGCKAFPLGYQYDPVGGFAPNGWGLYDMHGGVQEWCKGVESYVARGGCTGSPDRMACDSSWREALAPESRGPGCRLVLSLVNSREARSDTRCG